MIIFTIEHYLSNKFTKLEPKIFWFTMCSMNATACTLLVWKVKWLVFTQSLCLNYQKNNWGETQNGTNNKTLAPCLIWCGFRRNDLTHGCCHALGSSPAQRIYNDWINTGERLLCKLTTVCGSVGMVYLQKTFHFRSKKNCCRYFSSKKQVQRLFQESSEIHPFWRKQASLTHSTSCIIHHATCKSQN